MSAAGALAPLRAGFEDYLPLLIMFVIWWVSSRRGKSNPPPAEGADQAPSARRLGSTAAATEEITPLAVLRQMLFGGLEFPNLPDNQLPPESQRPAEFGNTYSEESAGHHEPPSPSPAKRVIAAPPAARAESKQRPVVPTVTPRVGPHPERLSLVQARIPRRELQRAVAWSEVLAPPVGLRDPSRQPSPTLSVSQKPLNRRWHIL